MKFRWLYPTVLVWFACHFADTAKPYMSVLCFLLFFIGAALCHEADGRVGE